MTGPGVNMADLHSILQSVLRVFNELEGFNSNLGQLETLCIRAEECVAFFEQWNQGFQKYD